MPSYRALQITTPSTDFRKATKVVEIAEVPTPSTGNVVVQNHYVGINATDINVTNGAYCNTPAPGLEGDGVVYAVGEGVSNVVMSDAVEYLKSLGVDRVINYSKEDISTVFKDEYPKGLDLVFESVGGEMFKAALENMAVYTRTIMFGMISGYRGATVENLLLAQQLNGALLRKSASVRSFLLFNHIPHILEHIAKLLKLIHGGKLKSGINPTEFKGLEGIADAINRMYAKENIGKLVVKLV